MARRRRNAAVLPLLFTMVIVIALAATGWIYRHRVLALFASHAGAPASVPSSAASGTGAPASADAVAVSAARIDAANDGRRVRVNGSLAANAPARDAELGISAKAAVLLRRVEIFQWHESCSGDDCRYAADWSEKPIDSRRFRHGEGHANPPAKLASAHFAATALRLGAFAVGADIVAAQGAATDLSVHAAELPPNLAASFADAGGALYAGGDPSHPKVGEMRISYRVVPLGPLTLTGFQRGGALTSD